MSLFRSKEDVVNWCESESLIPGAVVPLQQVWELAKGWYADRLAPGYERTLEEAQAILHRTGFTAPYWDLL